MMSNEFEEAFSEFLDRQAYDEAESALFDGSGSIFGRMESSRRTDPHSAPDSSAVGTGRRGVRPDLTVRAVRHERMRCGLRGGEACGMF